MTNEVQEKVQQSRIDAVKFAVRSRGRGVERKKKAKQKRSNHNTRKNKKHVENQTDKVLRMKGKNCFPMKTIKKEELHGKKIWSSCIVLGGYNRCSLNYNLCNDTVVSPGLSAEEQSSAKRVSSTCSTRLRAVDIARYTSIKYIGRDLKRCPKESGIARFWEIKPANDRAILILLDGSEYDASKEKPNNVPLIPTLKLSDKYIVLCFATQSDLLRLSIKCNGNDDVMAMRSTRRSILNGKGGNHHKSEGQYYAFGLKGSYGKMNHGISVGSYVGTYVPNEASQKVQDKINDSMVICENTIEHYCPGLWSTSFSVLSKLVQFSKKVNVISGVGDTHGCLCVNARTRVPHTEADSSYTACAVPTQENKTNNKYFFVFHVTSTLSIRIPMKPGLVMLYNAHLLTHQQTRLEAHTDDFDFQNYTRYCSKKLAANAGASIARVFPENVSFDFEH